VPPAAVTVTYTVPETAGAVTLISVEEARSSIFARWLPKWTGT